MIVSAIVDPEVFGAASIQNSTTRDEAVALLKGLGNEWSLDRQSKIKLAFGSGHQGSFRARHKAWTTCSPRVARVEKGLETPRGSIWSVGGSH